MLVLKNGNGVMAEGGKPLGNNEVNALRIENTDRIKIGFVTTGPIALSWGDGTMLNLSTQASRYNASKVYSSVGNWDVSITNPENVKEIYLDDRASTNKLNTNVSWFSQFVNCERITLFDASFIGDLAPVIDKMWKLCRIQLEYLYNSTMSLNVSNCKSFWNRCLFVKIIDTPKNVIQGSYTDVDLILECEYIYLSNTNIGGEFSGIIKNGYTKLAYFYVYIYGTATQGAMTNLGDWVIPDTLLKIDALRGFTNSHGSLDNFNFKNLQSFCTEGAYTSCNISNNASFEYAISHDLSRLQIAGVTNCYLDIDLVKFTRSIYYGIQLSSYPGYNRCFGDITELSKKTVDVFIVTGGLMDGKVFGTLNLEFKAFGVVSLANININISADVFKYIFSKANWCNLYSLPNATGDISGCYFNCHYNGWTILISNLPNLYADITTFTFNPAYINEYGSIRFYANPHFTGDLGNLTLWQNKQEIDLRNCAYTNIQGFVRKVFANRNTCLKAAGGMTRISVQGNVDNNQLTGIEQQPPLGTYTGNVNDLTEAQIDNLAAGKDYTGTGTSTPWTDKEKIWVITKLKNSSTDSSLRYRCTFSY